MNASLSSLMFHSHPINTTIDDTCNSLKLNLDVVWSKILKWLHFSIFV